MMSDSRTLLRVAAHILAECKDYPLELKAHAAIRPIAPVEVIPQGL